MTAHCGQNEKRELQERKQAPQLATKTDEFVPKRLPIGSESLFDTTSYLSRILPTSPEQRILIYGSPAVQGHEYFARRANTREIVQVSC